MKVWNHIISYMKDASLLNFVSKAAQLRHAKFHASLLQFFACSGAQRGPRWHKSSPFFFFFIKSIPLCELYNLHMVCWSYLSLQRTFALIWIRRTAYSHFGINPPGSAPHQRQAWSGDSIRCKWTNDWCIQFARYFLIPNESMGKWSSLIWL